jgi:capsular exopolysaccharide synthesis family protein
MRDRDPARPFPAPELRALPRPPRNEAPAAPPASAVPVEESALRDVIATLRRRSTILLVCVVALPAGALGYSLSAGKEYTATAKLLFRDPGFDQKLLGGPVLAPSVDPAREAATNIGLVSLETVAGRAASAITSRRLTPAEIIGKVTVAAQGQSNVVAVSAVDGDPEFAARLANTISRQYIAFRRDADRSKIDQAVRLVQRQLRGLTAAQRDGSQGRSLRQQVNQLRVLAALQTGNAELVQRALAPDAPSSPKPLRNAILALILALALGVGLALLLDRLDSRLRGGDDAERLLGRPVLGTIPESSSLRGDHGDALHLAGQEAEAFRTLRANLRYYDIDHDVRSLLVTSSAPGDGKSTVARYLAATAAAAGVHAVLVEADLRRPTLNALYPVLRPRGLSEVLSDQATLAATIQQLPVSVAGAPTGKTLDVIGAGSPPPNPTDLLESERMRAVLADLHETYDLVVVDSSPVTVVPDSIPILREVDGVLVVMRESRSTTAGARRLRDQLTHLGVTPLGLVMNGTPPADSSSVYGYYAAAAANNAAAGKTPAGGKAAAGASPAGKASAGASLAGGPRRLRLPRRRAQAEPAEPAAPRR